MTETVRQDRPLHYALNLSADSVQRYLMRDLQPTEAVDGARLAAVAFHSRPVFQRPAADTFFIGQQLLRSQYDP